MKTMLMAIVVAFAHTSAVAWARCPGTLTPKIDLEARLEGQEAVFEVWTNLCGLNEGFASVDLAGQKDNDVYVGKSKKIRMYNGRGEVKVDTSTLPQGDYKLSVAWYPRWGAQDAKARAAKPSEKVLSNTIRFRIQKAGPSAKDVARLQNAQREVMLNTHTGMPWSLSAYESKYGASERLAVSRYNPRVISAHYFPTLHMTFIVNTLRGTLVTWRLGKTAH